MSSGMNHSSESSFTTSADHPFEMTYKNMFESSHGSGFVTTPYSDGNYTSEEATPYRGLRHICITTQEISTTINIVAICIGLVIIFGNILVLLVMFRYPASRFTPFNWLLCHLAVADFIIGVTVFWWYGVAEILQIQISNMLKVGFYGLSVMSVLASLEGLMMIALDRYYLILRPRNYTSAITKRRLAATIIVMWILPSILELVVPLTGWSCVNECDCRIHNVSPDDVYCFGEQCSQILPPLTKLQLYITGIVSLVMFVITISLYIIIFYGVRKQAKKMKQHRSPARSVKPKSPRTPKETPARSSALTPQSPSEFKRAVTGWRNNLATVDENFTPTEPAAFQFHTFNKSFESLDENDGLAETPMTPLKNSNKTINRQESKMSNVTTTTELSLTSDKCDSPIRENVQFQLGEPVKRTSRLLKPDADGELNNLHSTNDTSLIRVALRPKSLHVEKDFQPESNRKSMSSVFKTTFGRFKRRGRRRTSASRKKDLAVMRSMFIILSVFIVTTAPLMFFVIYTFEHNDRGLKEIFNYLLQVTTLNSLLNPFLYFWRIPHMRRKLAKLTHATYFEKKWKQSGIWRRLHPGKTSSPRSNIRDVSEPSWESADSSMHE